MPRAQFYDSVFNIADSKPVLLLNVSVYRAPPFAAAPLTELAQIYNQETGVGSPGNPFQTTLYPGIVKFWAEPGSYDVKLEDGSSPPKVSTTILRWNSLPGDDGVIREAIAPGAVGTSEIADGAVTTSKLADGAITEDKLTAPARLPVGTIVMTAAATADTGFLLCDGAAVSRSTYAALFARIASTYGSGNGTTTFNVPDLRGRVPVGVDGTAARLTANDALGQSGGEEQHTLNVAEMPSHSHTVTTYQNGGVNVLLPNLASYVSNPSNVATSSVGGGGAHNNMPPFQIVQYQVKT